MTIAELANLRESEDHIEFKAARKNFSYRGGSNSKQSMKKNIRFTEEPIA